MELFYFRGGGGGHEKMARLLRSSVGISIKTSQPQVIRTFKVLKIRFFMCCFRVMWHSVFRPDMFTKQLTGTKKTTMCRQQQ